jgi:protoporphyrinogen IX oxidase
MWSFKISLFIHVLSIASWFGGISLMAMYLRNATRSNDEQTMSQALTTAHRWNLTMMVPTSVLTFISGMYLLMQHTGSQPLWLLVKERFGTLFILVFILIITIYGRKLLKAAQKAGSSNLAATLLKRYILILNLSVLCMVILIFFVTTKIT